MICMIMYERNKESSKFNGCRIRAIKKWLLRNEKTTVNMWKSDGITMKKWRKRYIRITVKEWNINGVDMKRTL